MDRKVFLIFLAILIFWMPVSAEAREARPPWKILDEALTYLRAEPEVAWVRFEGHNVLIGWRGLPKNFARINQIAAKRAARALHNEITVYSLRAEQASLKEGDAESYLCKTTANPQEIVESNCR